MFEDITVNVVTDNYELKSVKQIGGGGYVSQPKKYMGKEMVLVEVPFYDMINIESCGRYDSDEFLISVVSSRIIKDVVGAYSKGAIYCPKETVSSEMIIIDPNENFRVGINVLTSEYYTYNVRNISYVSSKGKDSEIYKIHCPAKWAKEYVTIIPIDDTLTITRLEEGYKIYSESIEMVSNKASQANLYNCSVAVPESLKGKECLVFKTPEHFI